MSLANDSEVSGLHTGRSIHNYYRECLPVLSEDKDLGRSHDKQREKRNLEKEKKLRSQSPTGALSRESPANSFY